MCLYKITEQPVPTPDTGWKVFRIDGEGKSINSPRMFDDRGHKINEWIVDTYNFKLETEADEVEGSIGKFKKYTTGFHIFLNLDDAKIYRSMYSQDNFVIKQVKFRQVVAWGTQRMSSKISCVDAPCVVSQEMFIMDEKVEENVSV